MSLHRESGRAKQPVTWEDQGKKVRTERKQFEKIETLTKLLKEN